MKIARILRFDIRKRVDNLYRRVRRFTLRPPVGSVNLGSLHRLTPISQLIGYDRGLPIDRYYIERFLLTYASDIQGHVLEIAEDHYTRKFGGNRVTKSDVLHVCEGNPIATIVADLTCADQIPSDSFDCVIFTQTLQVIYDVRAAIRTIYRILKPGGVLLATSHGICRIDRHDMDRWGEYWRLSSLSARLLFEEVFPVENIKVRTHGNVLAAILFLHGLAAEELTKQELDYHDPDFELLITIKAVKPV